MVVTHVDFLPVFPCMYIMHIKVSRCWIFMKIVIKILKQSCMSHWWEWFIERNAGICYRPLDSGFGTSSVLDLTCTR